jgi:hypothetical protein
MSVEVRLRPQNFSCIVADAMLNDLVFFRGLKQDQGDWMWTEDFNRRLMPSLKPNYSLNLADSTLDKSKFLQSWNEFYRIQRYTDGEGFFLCYPAAYQFGIFAKSGVFDDSLQPNWSESYLRDQDLTALGNADTRDDRNSMRYDSDVRRKYSVTDNHLQTITEFNQLIASTVDEKVLQVVQVSCQYPMFGNKRFGHYISIVNCSNDDQVLIAGSLAPYGIYDTPFALVNKGELSRYIVMSKSLQLFSERSSDTKISDGKNDLDTEVYSLKLT